MREHAFDPNALLTALRDGDVEFVLIGGFAAMLHGSPILTQDIDITPARDAPNLARLARVLRDLDAVVLSPKGDEEPDWPIDDQHLRLRETTFLTTRVGLVDVVINPAAANGYPDLADGAVEVAIPDGPTILVAPLQRIIDSKRAANRPKDHAALPVLEALLHNDADTNT